VKGVSGAASGEQRQRFREGKEAYTQMLLLAALLCALACIVGAGAWSSSGSKVNGLYRPTTGAQLAASSLNTGDFYSRASRLPVGDTRGSMDRLRMAPPNQPPNQPNEPNQPPKRETTPMPVPTVGLGKDQYDVISRLLKDRILLLGSEVNDDVANVMVSQMLYLASADPEADITLYINSPGGSVQAGLAIFDTMQYIPCDVSTVCFGMAASMGAFLLSAGTKGKRRSLPNSRIMIHQVHTHTHGLNNHYTLLLPLLTIWPFPGPLSTPAAWWKSRRSDGFGNNRQAYAAHKGNTKYVHGGLLRPAHRQAANRH